jgi:hypothetical protein
MREKIPVKPVDVLIIILALGLTVFTGYTAYVKPSGRAQVLIQGPDQVWVFPLSTEEVIRVRGILGDDTVVRIHGNEAWAESSPCTNQICVGMGRISNNSFWPWVACLPNNVFFMIEGTDDKQQHPDAIAW